MLAGAGLGDDALLAHPPRHHDLAEHIVDLVRAGMIELLALEVDLRAAEMFGEALGEIQRRRPPDIVLEIAVHLGLECRIGLGVRVGLLQSEDQRHQRFRDKAAAENTEMPPLVGPAAEGIGQVWIHRCLSSWPGTAGRKDGVASASLSRPSTSCLLRISKDVDARDEPGHDAGVRSVARAARMKSRIMSGSL